MSNVVKISVVIPTYNKLPRLRLTLLSLEYQSIEPSWYEVVIVDDGSTDGTVAYCNSVQKRMNIKVISIENNGRSFARNIGVKNAEGKWIIFIDDDGTIPLYSFTTPIPGKSGNVILPFITSIPLKRSLAISRLPSRSAKSTAGEN